MRSIIKFFRSSPDEILDQAIRRAALLHGDAQQAAIAASYYAILLADTDPHIDWWRFADLKQRHVDSITEHVLLTERADKAAGQVRMLITGCEL